MVGNALYPGVYPAGHPLQFSYVILANAAAELAYANNAVAPVSTLASGGASSWENRHHA
jgi:hypothetical protein